MIYLKSVLFIGYTPRALLRLWVEVMGRSEDANCNHILRLWWIVVGELGGEGGVRGEGCGVWNRPNPSPNPSPLSPPLVGAGGRLVDIRITPTPFPRGLAPRTFGPEVDYDAHHAFVVQRALPALPEGVAGRPLPTEGDGP